jgi:lipopolysaccharide biosynthesis protein
MRSICFFSSYSTQEAITYYIKFYLEELLNHFSEVVFITNERPIDESDINYLQSKKIPLMLVKNEGYDFGMWFKGFMAYPMEAYDRVGLVNDSAILFKPLDATFEWVNKNDLDFCGLIDSLDIQYHLQSYFLIINKKAIIPTFNYFKRTGLVNGYNEVIKAYEIGLSAHLISEGFKIGAMYNRRHSFPSANPSFFMLTELINDGIPLIKKKILFNTYTLRNLLTWYRMDFKVNPNYYIQTIKKANEQSSLIDLHLAIKDAGYKKSKTYIYGLQFFVYMYKIALKIKIISLYRKCLFLKYKITIKVNSFNFR